MTQHLQQKWNPVLRLQMRVVVKPDRLQTKTRLQLLLKAV
jgi:hypothetical protein